MADLHITENKTTDSVKYNEQFLFIRFHTNAIPLKNIVCITISIKYKISQHSCIPGQTNWVLMVLPLLPISVWALKRIFISYNISMGKWTQRKKAISCNFSQFGPNESMVTMISRNNGEKNPISKALVLIRSMRQNIIYRCVVCSTWLCSLYLRNRLYL